MVLPPAGTRRTIRRRGRRNQGQPLVEQVVVGEFVERTVVEQHGQVDLAAAQLLDEVAGEFFGQLQLDLRQLLTNRLQKGQGQRVRGAVRDAEDDLAARVAGRVAHAPLVADRPHPCRSCHVPTEKSSVTA